MRVLRILLFGLALSIGLARATPEQDYLQVYLQLNDAERLQRQVKIGEALEGFEDAYWNLQKIRQAHRDWETALVLSRLEDCRAKIKYLRGSFPHSISPTPFTGPHVFPQPEVYPWKTNILTTVFWTGEGSSASGWNPNWVRDNGGADDQFAMSGYASENHASMLNPFYVALPFNDLTNPKLAEKWVPGSWIKLPRSQNAVSACKDRWVEIKNGAGRICFAQWEDIGPMGTDDAAYVFGGARPVARRGLNVSPAVAKYLGFDSATTVSWRFVDDDEVLPGMWLRYDEQAVLFRAIHQSKMTQGG